MTLDDEDTENGLQLVPGSHGMNVPSTCTIIIIAGKIRKALNNRIKEKSVNHIR